MLQITDNHTEQQLLPLFRLAFRPFFLVGTLFAIFSAITWGLLLFATITLPSQLPPTLWHAHEMLFGFAGAIILGFLLTAVQNWTGHPGLKGYKLGALVTLWLLGRIAIFTFPPNLYWLTMILELSWMPLAAIVLARSVLYAKQWRNLFFVPLLFAMTLLNGISLYAFQKYDYLLAQDAIWSMLFLVLFIIAVMGGRVIPFFTSKGTDSEKVQPIKVLEYCALLPLLLLAFTVFFTPLNIFSGYLALLAGISNSIRLIRWRPQITLPVPLLWSLHLSYLLLAIGLILYSMALFIPAINAITMIHLSAIGGIGGVILAMISRVSLGHTGRPLISEKWMNIAFASTAISGLIRLIYPYIQPNSPIMGYWLSIIFWCTAFVLFVICYAKMLLSARIDQRPG
ncbi:NnrS family protein [Psychromonas sp. MME2]|uniref:NnrS family protein n=1 Tax=unclassified Psychromonas TaxID=2614957 RepID=UPI00339C4E75